MIWFNQIISDWIEKFYKDKYPHPDVAKEALKPFIKTAKEITQKYEPEEALCRALAVISGHTEKLKQRS